MAFLIPPVQGIHPVLAPHQTPRISPVVQEIISRIPYANGVLEYYVPLKDVDADVLKDWLAGIGHWKWNDVKYRTQTHSINKTNPDAILGLKNAKTQEAISENIADIFDAEALFANKKITVSLETAPLEEDSPLTDQAMSTAAICLDRNGPGNAYRIGISFSFYDFRSLTDKTKPKYPVETAPAIVDAKKYLAHAFYSFQRLIELQPPPATKTAQRPDIVLDSLNPEEKLRLLESGQRRNPDSPSFSTYKAVHVKAAQDPELFHSEMTTRFGKRGELLAKESASRLTSLRPLILRAILQQSGLDSVDEAKTGALITAFQNAAWDEIYSLANRKFIDQLAATIGADPLVFYYWMNQQALHGVEAVFTAGGGEGTELYIDDPSMRDWIRREGRIGGTWEWPPSKMFVLILIRTLYSPNSPYLRARQPNGAQDSDLISELIAFLNAQENPPLDRLQAIAELAKSSLPLQHFLAYTIRKNGGRLRELQQKLGVPESNFYFNPAKDIPVIEQMLQNPDLGAYLWLLQKTLNMSLLVFAEALGIPLEEWETVKAKANGQGTTYQDLERFAKEQKVNLAVLDRLIATAYESTYFRAFKPLPKEGAPPADQLKLAQPPKKQAGKTRQDLIQQVRADRPSSRRGRTAPLPPEPEQVREQGQSQTVSGDENNGSSNGPIQPKSFLASFAGRQTPFIGMRPVFWFLENRALKLRVETGRLGPYQSVRASKRARFRTGKARIASLHARKGRLRRSNLLRNARRALRTHRLSRARLA